MSTEPESEEIVSITERIGNLSLNISVVVHSSAPTASSGSSSSQPAAASSDIQPAVVPTWALRQVPEEPPQEVLSLSRQLRSSVNGFGPNERIRRAFSVGLEAAVRVRGDRGYFSGLQVGGRKIAYVVLFGSAVTEPFITTDFSYYSRIVRNGPGDTWDPISVSHGFPSFAEAEAFCFGAGLRGLPHRLP